MLFYGTISFFCPRGRVYSIRVKKHLFVPHEAKDWLGVVKVY